MGGLGNHLPGYHFAKASLYETTIKDGTQYHLFRVTYTTGNDEITTAPANGVWTITIKNLTPIFPKKERKKRKREVEQKLFDVFGKYVGQRV